MKKFKQNNFNQNRPPPEWDLFALYESPLRYPAADFFLARFPGEFKSAIRKRKSARARADRHTFRKK
jgi:hypothetical protein